MRVSAPDTVPWVAGVKLAEMLHVAPAANVAQLFAITAKPAAAVTEVTVTGAPDVFLIVVVNAGAVVFIDCPPKSRVEGVAVSNWAVDDGVTVTVAEATLVPSALVAVTVHV